MSRDFAEVLILVATAIPAGLLLFVSEVIQKIMSEMDEATFKRFLGRLEYHAMRSPTAMATSLLTSVACVPYFIFFGFSHWWFTAGIAVWFVAAVASKLMNLPVYRKVEKLADEDAAALKAEREKLQTANRVRAWVTLASMVLMVIGLAK